MRARRDPLHGLSAPLAGLALLIALGLAPVARAGVPDLPGSEQLSDERTFTRWAYPEQTLPIRESPDQNGLVLATIWMSTEDGLPEVYPLLDSWTDPSGRKWLRVRAPMKPEALTGWVEASAFGQPQLVRTELVIERSRLRATLYNAGHRVWRSRIGVGKPKTPTPSGHFWIREKLHSTKPDSPYGPWAFGTSAYSGLSDWPGGGVIGIHGTNQPDLIPGRPSHGCIRVPNRAIRRLARLMSVGTPVWIR